MKPELRRDLTVASWPFEIRYYWVLLWGTCDDAGRADDDARLLKSDCFPLDDNVTARKVENWTDRLRQDGRICRYEVDGRKLLHVINWKHQRINRPSPSHLPPCPHHERAAYEDYRKAHAEVVSLHGGLTASSLSPQVVIPEDSPPEQGAGNREQGTRERAAASTTGNQLLDAHCAAYPHTPPRDVQKKTGQQIDKLLDEGIPSRVVAQALKLMRERPKLGPGILPTLVVEVQNSPEHVERTEAQQRYKGALS